MHLEYFEFLGAILGKVRALSAAPTGQLSLRLYGIAKLRKCVPQALFEGIVVQPLFAHYFLRRLLGTDEQSGLLVAWTLSLFACLTFAVLSGKHNFLDDLQSVDSELYRNLMGLKVQRRAY